MNGIITLNKPSGISSHSAVARVKKLLGVKKAGHTGTLDPMATGVLPVCLNEATKITRFFLDSGKEYRVRVCLGERTDTYDSTGTVIQENDTSLLKNTEIVDAVMSFQGQVRQLPPMYSAVKIGGEKLYTLARKGMNIERPERTVSIHRIEILRIDMPYVDLVVSCSKGTYIRTLCNDIGDRLGCGAHMAGLERLTAGPFQLKNAARFEDLESRDLTDKPFYTSIDSALRGLRDLALNSEEYEKAKNGIPVKIAASAFQENEFVKLKSPSGMLFAIGKKDLETVRIERILHL